MRSLCRCPITVTSDRRVGKTAQVTDALILSKTLKLHYRVPGEAAARSLSKAILDSGTG